MWILGPSRLEMRSVVLCGRAMALAMSARHRAASMVARWQQDRDMSERVDDSRSGYRSRFSHGHAWYIIGPFDYGPAGEDAEGEAHASSEMLVLRPYTSAGPSQAWSAHVCDELRDPPTKSNESLRRRHGANFEAWLMPNK
jgi:hypothetical protein